MFGYALLIDFVHQRICIGVFPVPCFLGYVMVCYIVSAFEFFFTPYFRLAAGFALLCYFVLVAGSPLARHYVLAAGSASVNHMFLDIGSISVSILSFRYVIAIVALWQPS